MNMNFSLSSFGCMVGFMPPSQRATLSALRALKIAQRRLKPEVRSRLLLVSSARSGADLAPAAWRFVFADAGTSDGCRVVTVAAKNSSEHPETVEAFAGERSAEAASAPPMAQARLLVDSDKALEKVRATSKLKGAKAVELRLSQAKGAPEAVWSVRIFGESDAMLASFRVGAKTGTVETEG